MAYEWQRYFSIGKAELNPEMIAALICREMGWTWQEYQNQPAWFVDIIVEMLKAEGEEVGKRLKDSTQ